MANVERRTIQALIGRIQGRAAFLFRKFEQILAGVFLTIGGKCLDEWRKYK
ncbi:hypothetical protein [Weizmannia acidilactici]|uniref:hypothetical protein n=1 Tax=Weizmannia acidilactici TaxID=2607726 RepID=UPI0012861125|nr:hypothetical protein [Weizmannia acidilactici]GER67617.1 hypothetical protein BpJC4_20880 [Weizmannia acidilactici]